ncbi:hypothetical protein ACFL6X_00510 [Candidatus Latescibacterota bacterium]
MDFVEKGTTRRHTIFCVDRKRHTRWAKVVSEEPKTITVFGKELSGWIVTTEEPVIDKTISLVEALEGLVILHDNE